MGGGLVHRPPPCSVLAAKAANGGLFRAGSLEYIGRFWGLDANTAIYISFKLELLNRHLESSGSAGFLAESMCSRRRSGFHWSCKMLVLNILDGW